MSSNRQFDGFRQELERLERQLSDQNAVLAGGRNRLANLTDMTFAFESLPELAERPLTIRAGIRA